MIYKIKTQSEIAAVADNLPEKVVQELKRVAKILDDNYNSQGTDGGYILIAEDIADLISVRRNYFDYTDMIYEFKDALCDDWVSILYIVGTEYSITLITHDIIV